MSQGSAGANKKAVNREIFDAIPRAQFKLANQLLRCWADGHILKNYGFFSSRPKPLPSIPPGGSPSSRYKSAPPTLREKTDYK